MRVSRVKSNLEKGKDFERLIKENLVKEGFEVWQPQWNRYGVRDILNRFDLIAYKKETGEVRLIQTTAGKKSDWTRRVKKIEDFVPKIVTVQCIGIEQLFEKIYKL